MRQLGVRLIIWGQVQGVFFRHSAKACAEKLGLTGWVRNQGDDQVEILAEGEEKKLEEFVKWCHEGPSLAQVEKVKVKWSQASGKFPSFDIIHLGLPL